MRLICLRQLCLEDLRLKCFFMSLWLFMHTEDKVLQVPLVISLYSIKNAFCHSTCLFLVALGLWFWCVFIVLFSSLFFKVILVSPSSTEGSRTRVYYIWWCCSKYPGIQPSKPKLDCLHPEGWQILQQSIPRKMVVQSNFHHSSLVECFKRPKTPTFFQASPSAS